MTNYEYKTIKVGGVRYDKLGEVLTEHTADGWRAVTPIVTGETLQAYVLERPVEE